MSYSAAGTGYTRIIRFHGDPGKDSTNETGTHSLGRQFQPSRITRGSNRNMVQEGYKTDRQNEPK